MRFGIGFDSYKEESERVVRFKEGLLGEK